MILFTFFIAIMLSYSPHQFSRGHLKLSYNLVKPDARLIVCFHPGSGLLLCTIFMISRACSNLARCVAAEFCNYLNRQSYWIFCDKSSKYHTKQISRYKTYSICHRRINRLIIFYTRKPFPKCFCIKWMIYYFLSNKIKNNRSRSCIIQCFANIRRTYSIQILQSLKTIKIKTKWVKRRLTP